MRLLYVVLEKFPFNQRFEALPTCWLQDAEFKLQMNRLHYHERAVRIGELLLYGWEDAQRIAEFRHSLQPYNEHQVLGFPVRE